MTNRSKALCLKREFKQSPFQKFDSEAPRSSLPQSWKQLQLLKTELSFLKPYRSPMESHQNGDIFVWINLLWNSFWNHLRMCCFLLFYSCCSKFQEKNLCHSGQFWYRIWGFIKFWFFNQIIFVFALKILQTINSLLKYSIWVFFQV